MELITAAVLKLFPKPQSVETAFVGLASPRAALDLLDLARDMAGGEITSFELIPRLGLDFVLGHFDTRDVLAKKFPWYVLLELSSQSQDGLDARLLALLEAGSARHIIEDAAIAASLEQRQNFWKLREFLPEAQTLEGGSIKHDVSVPIADIPVFLEEVFRAVSHTAPGARLVSFGHVGDGNIHCNISQPIGADRQAFLARWDEINAIVYEIVLAHKGSISAEHGIGQLKRDLLPKVKDRVAMDVMRAIKQALDIPIFLEEVFRAVSHAVPGARLVPFGHVGDGNIHCNISQPIGADRQTFLARWDEINAIVYEIVLAHKGSISAEHGIGQLKRDLLPKVKDKVAMDIMRAIKQTLDPKGILNPGKVL